VEQCAQKLNAPADSKVNKTKAIRTAATALRHRHQHPAITDEWAWPPDSLEYRLVTQPGSTL